MPIKVCKRIIVFLLPLLVAACGDINQSRLMAKEDSGVRKTSEPEEYLVYNFLIEQKYIRGNVGLIVIKNRTLAQTIESSGLDETLKIMSNRLNLSEQDLLDDFLMKNQQACILEDRFAIKVKHALVSEEEISKFSESRDFWNAFDEKYPDAQGILSLSRVGFNHAKNLALVYIGNKGSASTGAGYYVLLAKRDGKWLIQDEAMAWVI